MKRSLIIIVSLLSLLLVFSGCSTNEFTQLQGERYTAQYNGDEGGFVLADDGKCTFSSGDHTDPFQNGILPSFIVNDAGEGDLPSSDPLMEFDVEFNTEQNVVGDYKVENGRFSMTYRQNFVSLTISGADKDEFIDTAKEKYRQSYDCGNISKEEYDLYIDLLNGKSVDIFSMDNELGKLVLTGRIDQESNEISVETFEQYYKNDQINIFRRYNGNGFVVKKTVYSYDGAVKSDRDYYDDGEEKLFINNYDDGMQETTEWIRENDRLIKKVYTHSDGYRSVEYYDEDEVKYRSEEYHNNGIMTYALFDKNGNETEFSAIVGGNDEVILLTSFIVNPQNGEALEKLGIVYDLDLNVLIRTVYEYNEDYVLICASELDAEDKLITENRFDQEGREIYFFSQPENIRIESFYDSEDADVVRYEYSIDPDKLIAIVKEKNDVAFYGMNILENGNVYETYNEAANGEHYSVKEILKDENGVLIKVTENESFIDDLGNLVKNCPMIITEYSNGEICKISEYYNEYDGSSFVYSALKKVSYYENGVLISVEEFEV